MLNASFLETLADWTSTLYFIFKHLEPKQFTIYSALLTNATSLQQETTSLAERIRLLTCDVEDEPEEHRASPAGASADKMSNSSDKSSDKSYNSISIDKNCEKAFGSASSSSSSSTISAPLPSRHQPPDLGDVHQEPQKVTHSKM